MRIITFIILSVISVNTYAGWFGTFVTGAAGGYVGGNLAGGSCQPAIAVSRAAKVNTLLWEMHRTAYNKDYDFYLNYLENSQEFKENIYFPDTVAFVYFDHGEHKKALSIYESHVIPWLQFEPLEMQGRYRTIHEAFKERADCLVLCGEIEERIKQMSMTEDDKIKQTEEVEEKSLIKRVDESAKKLGGRIRDKARDIIESQSE